MVRLLYSWDAFAFANQWLGMLLTNQFTPVFCKPILDLRTTYENFTYVYYEVGTDSVNPYENVAFQGTMFPMGGYDSLLSVRPTDWTTMRFRGGHQLQSINFMSSYSWDRHEWFFFEDSFEVNQNLNSPDRWIWIDPFSHNNLQLYRWGVRVRIMNRRTKEIVAIPFVPRFDVDSEVSFYGQSVRNYDIFANTAINNIRLQNDTLYIPETVSLSTGGESCDHKETLEIMMTYIEMIERKMGTLIAEMRALEAQMELLSTSSVPTPSTPVEIEYARLAQLIRKFTHFNNSHSADLLLKQLKV